MAPPTMALSPSSSRPTTSNSAVSTILRQTEASNRTLQQENETLHRQLMTMISHGKDSKHLDSTIERRRRQLEQQRLERYIERVVDMEAHEESLKRTLQQIQSGRDVKSLSSDTESRRQQLAFERLERSAEHVFQLEAQEEALKATLQQIQAGRDVKALSDDIERQRHRLAVERRQRANEHAALLRLENQALKQRLRQVGGRDIKQLDSDIEAQHLRLKEQREFEKLQREEIRQAENRVHSQLLLAAQSPDYHATKNEPRLQENDDEQVGMSLKERQAQFYARRERETLECQKALRDHQQGLQRLVRATQNGRDVKTLDDTVEEHRQLLQEKRHHNQVLHRLQLAQHQAELRALKQRAKNKIGVRGSGGTGSTASIVGTRKEFGSRISGDKQTTTTVSTTVSTTEDDDDDEMSQQQTRRGVAMASKVTLLTHGIMVKDPVVMIRNYSLSSHKRSNRRPKARKETSAAGRQQQQQRNGKRGHHHPVTIPTTPPSSSEQRKQERLHRQKQLAAENRALQQRLAQVASPCRQIMMGQRQPSVVDSNNRAIKTAASPTSVLHLDQFEIVGGKDRVASSGTTTTTTGTPPAGAAAAAALSVSMKRLQVAERTHAELKKHKAVLLERLAKAEVVVVEGNNGMGEEEEEVYFDC